MKALVKNKFIKIIFSFIIMTSGAVLAACALETFLIPNTILDGGVTGLSIIINKLEFKEKSLKQLLTLGLTEEELLEIVNQNAKIE